MIFVDSNLFVIDLRYRRDPDYKTNRRALERLAKESNGITSVVNVLEVCGILSFNLTADALHALYVHFAGRYGVAIIPGSGYETKLPAPTARDLLERMESGMSIKDAEIALIVEDHAPSLTAFLTWNAKHFKNRLPVPAVTPQQWLRGKTR